MIDVRAQPFQPDTLKRMRRLYIPVALSVLLCLLGCHSPYITATVSNRTTSPITLVEMDYPSASFGTQSIAPGQDFQYRFKVLGGGPTTILWTDTTGHNRKNSGPSLQEGDEGTLAVTFGASGSPTWSLKLVNRSGN